MKKIIPFDDYNRKIPPPDKWGEMGTVTTTFGHIALRNGWKIIEVNDEEDNAESWRQR
jgi:hypothetical protein